MIKVSLSESQSENEGSIPSGVTMRKILDLVGVIIILPVMFILIFILVIIDYFFGYTEDKWWQSGL